MDQYDISDEEDSGDRNYDDDREALAPTPRATTHLPDVRNSPETYDYDDAHEQIENVEVPEEEYSFEESNVYNEASFTTDDEQVASVEEEQFPVEPTPPSTPQVEKKAKKFGSTWTPSPRDTSKSTTIPPPLDTSSPATPTTEKKSKKFGSTWSPSPKNDSSHENKSYKSPASTPLRRNSSFSSVQSFNSVQKTISDTPSLESMTEGCYLLFDKQTGGRLTLQFAKSKVENAIGFWASGKEKKIQGFKFKQNQGRSELVKNLAGPDSKKKYFNGWCQFVKAAKSYNGFFCKFSKNAKIQVDVFVYFGETCEIVMIEDGQPFDVSLIDAVAVVPKGNTTFSGVRTGEYGTFLGRGDSAGASLAL